MLFPQVNLALFARILLFVFLLISCEIFSQGISNLWISGYNYSNLPPVRPYGVSTIDFESGFADTSTSSISMDFLDCNANISDSSGNLLFYTNGIYIANVNNDTMMNGSGLNPSVYTTQNINYGLRVKQGNLILPMPGNPSLYYLFHETLTWFSSVGDYRVTEIYYSTIDMSLDSGRGAVTQKNVVLLSDTLTIGSITACKHANGRDWWLVFHKSQGRRYYEYLLTPSGLQGPFIQDIGYSVIPRAWSWQACFSPDGSKYANVFSKDTIDIMDFDRCSGIFSNCKSILLNDSAAGRGVAFSPNSQQMYVSSALYLYQYSVYASSIDSSRILIDKFDAFAEPIPPLYTPFYLAQIAMDGKIYINTGNGTRWFNVINHPNNIGLNCDFLQHGLLLPTFNAFTIPNFPNYFLGKEVGSICDSLPSVVGHTNQEQGRHSGSSPDVRICTDERGEAISPLKDDYDEKKTYEYFLRMTSESLNKPE
jgi:hypothetical protein